MSLEHGPAGALDPARGTRRYALGARNAPENAPLNAGILPAQGSLDLQYRAATRVFYRREDTRLRTSASVPTREDTHLARIFCGERLPGVQDVIGLPCSSLTSPRMERSRRSTLFPHLVEELHSKFRKLGSDHVLAIGL